MIELNLKKFTSIFLLVVAATLILHLLIQRAFPQFIAVSVYEVLQINGFLIFLTIVHFLGLKWLFKKWPKHAGLLFTAMSLLKMVVSILFLLPFIFPPKAESIAIALNFMVVYFVFLTYEVVFLVKNMIKNHIA